MFIVIADRIGMNHDDNHRCPDKSDGVPTRFSIHHPIQKDLKVGIVPYSPGEFEGDPVFGEIDARLFRIPFK